MQLFPHRAWELDQPSLPTSPGQAKDQGACCPLSWVPKLFDPLNMTEDPKELLWVWFISLDIYLARNVT